MRPQSTSPSLHGAADDPGHAEGTGELYASATTRVSRIHDASRGAAIRKEHLGPHAARRLENERAMLTRLSGLEGVAQLTDAQSASCILLQDCGGVALSHVLRSGRCEIPMVLAVAAQLARTLSQVHRAGVLHRDINPSNIVLSSSRQPVLIDFDLAVPAEQHRAAAGGGRIVGTLGYVAPEQTGRTGHPVDQRADLYSLGVTLYQLATGRLPFEEQDPLQLIHDHLVREPAAPSQLDPRVPQALSTIILRLLAKSPEERYQSAEGVLHDLRRLRDELAAGGDGSFELGERDFAARLAPPVRLVGRDDEQAILRDALADARRTARRAVLIEGAAGVGKTTLIREFRPVAAEMGGLFVLGKFDQYQRDAAAAGALTQALRSLGQLLLAQAADELSALRKRLLGRLGLSAGLITRMAAEFAHVLGPQPDLPDVDPQKAEQRLQQAVVDLLGAIASPERPLVMVLDDLQWAGAPALRVFERLMHEPSLHGLLLVGAYRGKEVDAGHALAPMLQRWKLHTEAMLHIELGNLSSTGMRELVGRMLRLPHERADALAEAVGALSAGNPFDTVEIVNTLRHEGVLSLADQGWQWDGPEVRRFVGASSVIGLLAARIARLPQPSQLLVGSMSCLGASVEHELLACAAGLSLEELREKLHAPLEEGLLAADPDGLAVAHFRHDRVQQAVLGGLPGERRERLHLEMARRLAAHPAARAHAAQQYIACTRLLEDAREIRDVAALFHDVALGLVNAANPALADRYLAAADSLLEALGDARDAALLRRIAVARHATLYSLGRLEEADRFFARVRAAHSDALELVEPTCVQMRSVYIRGKMREALDLGLDLLKRLGLQVPAGFADPRMALRVDALTPWLQEDRALLPGQCPPVADRQVLATANLLSRAFPPAFFLVDVNALVWLTMECQRLWAAHGPCGSLVVALSRACMVLILTRDDYRTGYETSRHALEVGIAHGFEPETSEARHLFSISASHWFETLEDTIGHALRTRESLARIGDSSYSCFTYFVTSGAMLDCEPSLDNSVAEMSRGMAVGRLSGNNLGGMLVGFGLRLLRSLQGRTRAPGTFDDDEFDEQAFVADAAAPTVAKITYHLRRAVSAALFGDLPALLEHSAAAIPLLEATPGFYMTAHARLTRALALAWQLQSEMSSDASASFRELEGCRAWLAARAADQPYNFLHLLRLVEAEQAWAGGDLLKAADLFEAAMAEARARRRPWHAALITERAARFHLSRHWANAGQLLLARARDLYAAWGATAKVAQLERDDAFPRGHGPDARAPMVPSLSVADSQNVAADTLDLMGVLRASQALSSETSLESLAARVSEVLAALSGATRIRVLAWNEGQWSQLAPAPGESSITVAQAAERGLLPLTAVEYVQRTGEALVLDDGPGDDRFARDPYFAGVPFCSLLVVPIAGQGDARAMLILESRTSRAAFNAERLDAVKLIAGQLAVSLSNAQLYERLEQRVQSRTRDLAQTQAQLVATARRAGRAEVATNVLHNVGNVLNSINVSASTLRRTIDSSRIESLSRAIALMQEKEHDLGRLMESTAAGRHLRAYLGELVAALLADRREAMDDLDRLARSVEHITYVVATQQSEVGPSSVVEIAHPEEVLEEAVRLCAAAIGRAGADIRRECEEVPPLTLDKHRLVQILVNLIGNAAQAMEGMPARQRVITLGMRMVRGDGRERLRITVLDQGEGIAAENLPRIFSHGFTTREEGHGFGLHASALAAMEMGGRITAHSDGPGRGARFTIEIPVETA